MPYNLTTMQSIYHNQDEIVEISYNGSLIYQKQIGPDYTEPFYVQNITNENETLNIVKDKDAAPTLTIEYSTNKTTWQTLGTTSLTALTYTLQAGDKVYLRCNTNSWAISSARHAITGVSKVGGNTMSLLYGSNFTGQETTFPSGSAWNLFYLFSSNARLIDASNLLLPATTLTDHCYGYMFRNCTSLTSAPVLPATTLAGNCYEYMFINCTSLTSAPTLPATTLANYCYVHMFRGCTSFTSTPVLPATTLASNCYQNMFADCTSLTTAPVLPATTLANYCYSQMFLGCTSLTTAPVLPATTLIQRCYDRMFRNCTLLSNVTCLATSGIDTNASTNNWLQNISSSGIFTKAADVTWPTGVSGIPTDWTVIEQ